jgi:hypothetical protein
MIGRAARLADHDLVSVLDAALRASAQFGAGAKRADIEIETQRRWFDNRLPSRLTV